MTGDAGPASGDRSEIAGPAACLMLLASAAATLGMAVVVGVAMGDLVTGVCAAVLGMAWLGVSMTIAAGNDMPMPLQLGLLVTCPLVPLLVGAVTAAGFGVAVVVVTAVVAVGLVVALRRI